jgi:hypothetical protein
MFEWARQRQRSCLRRIAASGSCPAFAAAGPDTATSTDTFTARRTFIGSNGWILERHCD